jgi:hypothetical protein
MKHSALLLLLALPLVAVHSQAQQTIPLLSPHEDRSSAPTTHPQLSLLAPNPKRSAVLLTLGGLGAATLGTFAGAALGARVTTRYPCEDCGLEGLIYGGVAGGSTLLPLGVHLANGRRGNYGAALLASLGIGAAGLGVAIASQEGAVMLSVPVLQLVSSIAIERGTSR